MNQLLKLLLILSLAALTIDGFCQKLSRDNYKISIVEINESVMKGIGSTKPMYKGEVKVNAKGGQGGTYGFSFANMGSDFTRLAIKDKQKKNIPPFVYYDPENNKLDYKIVTGEEISYNLEPNITTEEIILEGVLIWLKLNK